MISFSDPSHVQFRHVVVKRCGDKRPVPVPLPRQSIASLLTYTSYITKVFDSAPSIAENLRNTWFDSRCQKTRSPSQPPLAKNRKSGLKSRLIIGPLHAVIERSRVITCGARTCARSVLFPSPTALPSGPRLPSLRSLACSGLPC